MKNKIIGFIPIKLNSKRLSKKALLNLKGLPYLYMFIEGQNFLRC